MIRVLGNIANRMMVPLGLKISRVHSRLSLPQMHYRFVSRFMYLEHVFRQISHLEGDIVECGIGQVAGETLHVQRRKEFFLNHLSVGFLIKCSDHLAGGNVHNITVSVFTAKATNGRQVAQIMDNLRTGKAAGFRPKHAVTGATAEP